MHHRSKHRTVMSCNQFLCHLTFSEECEIILLNACTLVAGIRDKINWIDYRSKEKKGPDAKELLKKYGYA